MAWLRRRASGRWHMPFYVVIGLLHEEARLTALRFRLVSEKSSERSNEQTRIFDLWDDYLLTRGKLRSNSLGNVLILIHHRKDFIRLIVQFRSYVLDAQIGFFSTCESVHFRRFLKTSLFKDKCMLISNETTSFRITFPLNCMANISTNLFKQLWKSYTEALLVFSFTSRHK